MQQASVLKKREGGLEKKKKSDRKQEAMVKTKKHPSRRNRCQGKREMRGAGPGPHAPGAEIVPPGVERREL